MNAKSLGLFIVAIFISGCSTPSQPPNVPAPSPVNDAAQIKLAEAAASVSNSMQELAAIEKAAHPTAQLPPPPNPVNIGMARLATVNWSGPVEPLLRKIAAVTGYRIRVLGRTPAIPALVTISAQNTPIADILRDASFQVEKKADIMLYPRSRVIEIRYRGL